MSVIDSNLKLNKLLINIKLKKKYINCLENKITKLNKVKSNSFKSLIFNSKKANSAKFASKHFIVKYIISIAFTKSNTLLHVTDFSGNLKFFLSEGRLHSQEKVNRNQILRSFFRILNFKGRFLKNQPVALHLKNVDTFKLRIIRILRKRFLIVSIKSFNSYPYNGCRLKKIRRKKIRKKTIV